MRLSTTTVALLLLHRENCRRKIRMYQRKLQKKALRDHITILDLVMVFTKLPSTVVLLVNRTILMMIETLLCIYEEYNVGAIIGEEKGVEIPAEATALDNGLLHVPKDGTHYKDKDGTSYEKEGSNIDRNEVCVLSGTFRHSSTVVVNKGLRSGLLPIPLAKSNGCNKPTSQSCCANADT